MRGPARGPGGRRARRGDRELSLPAALLDVDGTLVDTNYHHAVAWYRAFRQHGFPLPVWRIHRHIGMGGDKMIAALLSDEVEERAGDDIRAAEKALYLQLIEEVEPLPGARELLLELKRRGHTIVLVSSAKEDELMHYLELLDARGLADAWTSSADVEATKPDPDLVHAGLEKAGQKNAVMLGDSPWDCIAAKKARVATIAVSTGGFSVEELRDAGAVAVFESLHDLIESLDETPLAAVSSKN
ncbi:MAG TPA: HAD family hydrolase [Gaiellaceae bacterium]|nr:HAD family hydrolase [Gaiellaceae bacterium]